MVCRVNLFSLILNYLDIIRYRCIPEAISTWTFIWYDTVFKLSKHLSWFLNFWVQLLESNLPKVLLISILNTIHMIFFLDLWWTQRIHCHTRWELTKVILYCRIRMCVCVSVSVSVCSHIMEITWIWYKYYGDETFTGESTGVE